MVIYDNPIPHGVFFPWLPQEWIRCLNALAWQDGGSHSLFMFLKLWNFLNRREQEVKIMLSFEVDQVSLKWKGKNLLYKNFFSNIAEPELGKVHLWMVNL